MSFLERACPTCIKRDTSYSRSCFLRFGLGGRRLWRLREADLG